MIFTTFFVFAIMATFGAAGVISAAEPGQIGVPETPVRAENISVDGIKLVPEGQIVPSNKLYDYLVANAGRNHTIWVPDENFSIDLSTLQTAVNNTSSNNKRQMPCFGFIRRSVRETNQWWDDWHPASGCAYTGHAPNGAALQINWSYTKGMVANFEIGNAGALASLISGKIGFQVTESRTNGGTFTCKIPGNSVGQIWQQNYMAWGWTWEEKCMSCTYGPVDCWDATAIGAAIAPRDSAQSGVGVNVGCSTGYDKVQC